MWIYRQEWQRLGEQLAAAERRAELAEAALATEREFNRTTLTRAEDRALAAESALAAERAANREAERWWANALLRAKSSFPLPPKPVDQPPDTPELVPANQGLVPGMDDGEVEALIATGAEYGQKRDDVIHFLKRERGLE